MIQASNVDPTSVDIDSLMKSTNFTFTIFLPVHVGKAMKPDSHLQMMILNVDVLIVLAASSNKHKMIAYLLQNQS